MIYGEFMKINDDKNLYFLIGTNIKFFRKKSNLTQLQLADSVKISLSYLSKLEASKCNKSVSISTLNHIANALSVDIREFFVYHSMEE